MQKPLILSHHGCSPQIDPTAWIAPNATVIGEVKIGALSSVWFGTVIRGDVYSIEIGDETNIQDLSMLHVTRKKSKLKIGNKVTVGHHVTLHGCTIGDRVLVGMGAIIMDDAIIGNDCIVGAGALITEKMIVPNGSLVLGTPARVVRPLKQSELDFLPKSAANYVGDIQTYKENP